MVRGKESGPSRMTPVMYHYVRPQAGALHDYPYLALDDFERQLDYFSDHFGFVTREGFEQWVTGGAVPDGVLLTFDDGLSDHVEFVFPALRRRGVFGLFYIGSAPLTDGVVLEVHKLQLALGRLGGPSAFARVQARYPQLLEASGEDDLGHYAGQSSDLPTKRLKQLLNWKLDPVRRREVVDDLFALAFVGDDAPRAEDVYVDEAGVRQLVDDGMGVGAHGHEHLRLSGLTPDLQQREIQQACSLIKTLAGTLDWGYCYAHGLPGSFDTTSEQLVASAGCPFAFAVAADTTIETPIAMTARFALPRQNCNTFPSGAATIGGLRAS